MFAIALLITFSAGSLQAQERLYLVYLNSISSTEAYRDKNEVIFACSLSNESGPAAFVEILGTEHDADKYAAGHPMVSSGAFEYTVRPWWGNNKSFCNDTSKKLNYQDK